MNLRAISLAAIMLLTACAAPAAPTTTTQTGGAAPPPAEERAANQRINVAVKGLIGNPTPQASSFNFWLYWPMYDNLTILDENYKVNPGVAEKWDLAADGKSWRFTIRKDLKFSNGDPLTADDVAFTFNTIIQKSWPQKGQFASATEAKLVNETTVDLFTSQLDVTIPANMVYVWIVPKKYYESVGFDGYVAKPIGSGPYLLTDFKAADSMTFKKRGEPHPLHKVEADELFFKVVPENSQIVNGLITGDIDIATQVPWTGSQVDQLKKAGINIQAPIAIATSATFPEGTRTTFKTPLQDKRVRLAMNYAIDRQGLADKLFGGYAKPASQSAIPGTPSYINSLQPFPYDPAKAKALLAEAGYPNGFTLTNGFDYTTGQVITDVPVAIQGYLKSVGINVELIANENTIFVDKAYGRNNLVKGDIWIGKGGDTTGFGPSRTLTGCGKPAGAPASALFSCIPAWDATLDQVYAETDATKRGELLKKVTQISLDEVTTLLLFYEPNYLVASPKIKNLQIIHPVLFTVDTVYKIK